MAKAPTRITVETLNHEEATRKNIPTAEADCGEGDQPSRR